MFADSELYPISNIIKMCREEHQIRMKDLTLIRDVNNEPGDDPTDESNFDCVEGRQLIKAFNDYSQLLPWQKFAIVSRKTGMFYYLEDVDPAWKSNRDFRIDKIQYPLSVPDSFMDKNRWRQTYDPRTSKPALVFMDGCNPGDQFGIWYFRPHIFSIGTNETSAPPDHHEPIAKLGAAKFLRIAASRCTGFSDQPGLFESRDLSGLAERYNAQADRLEQDYSRLFESETPDIVPTFVNWELDSPTGERVFHPRGLY